MWKNPKFYSCTMDLFGPWSLRSVDRPCEDQWMHTCKILQIRIQFPPFAWQHIRVYHGGWEERSDTQLSEAWHCCQGCKWRTLSYSSQASSGCSFLSKCHPASRYACKWNLDYSIKKYGIPYTDFHEIHRLSAALCLIPNIAQMGQ